MDQSAISLATPIQSLLMRPSIATGCCSFWMIIMDFNNKKKEIWKHKGFWVPPGAVSCGIPFLYIHVSRVSHSSNDEEKMLIISTSRVSESMNYHFPGRRFFLRCFQPQQVGVPAPRKASRFPWSFSIKSFHPLSRVTNQIISNQIISYLNG